MTHDDVTVVALLGVLVIFYERFAQAETSTMDHDNGDSTMPSSRLTQCVAVTGLLLAGSGGLQAQSCVGLPSLSNVSHNVSVIGDAYGSKRTVLARAGGATQRIFGGIQSGYASTKVQDPQRAIIGADAGITIPLGNAPGALQLCPMVQFLLEFRLAQFANRTTQSLIGLAVGQEFRLSPRVAIAPFVDGALAQWGFQYDQTTADALPNAAPNRRTKNYELGGRYGAGFGLRLGEALTIRPSFHLLSGFRTTGGSENQPGATVAVTYSLRRK